MSENDLYQVTAGDGRSLGYYSASSKGQAKKAVIAMLEVKKLSGHEIYNVHQCGYGVANVVDGKVVLQPEVPAVADDQPSLDLGNETQASAG